VVPHRIRIAAIDRGGAALEGTKEGGNKVGEGEGAREGARRGERG